MTRRSPHGRSDMRERHVRLAAAPDIAPLIRATCRPREVVDGVALRDEFLVPPAAAVVAPPNLSAHQPAGYAASRHDDPPQMPGGWFGSAPLQSKLADGDGCKSDRWHADPFGSSCPLKASPQRASRTPHRSRDRRPLLRPITLPRAIPFRSPRHENHSESGGHSGQRNPDFELSYNHWVVTAIFLPAMIHRDP